MHGELEYGEDEGHSTEEHHKAPQVLEVIIDLWTGLSGKKSRCNVCIWTLLIAKFAKGREGHKEVE
jgi:hypothetical protein